MRAREINWYYERMLQLRFYTLCHVHTIFIISSITVLPLYGIIKTLTSSYIVWLFMSSIIILGLCVSVVPWVFTKKFRNYYSSSQP